MRIFEVLKSILIPILAIIVPLIVTIVVNKKKEKNSIRKEFPEIAFYSFGNYDIEGLIKKLKVENIIKLGIKVSDFDINGEYTNSLMLIGELVNIDIKEFSNSKFNIIVLCNKSNLVVEMKRMVGIEGKNIVFNLKNDLLLGSNENIGIVFENKYLIEEIWIQSKLYRYKIKISDLSEGINILDKKYIQIL